MFQNNLCMPESFDMNILHQLFNYKITFIYSQLENTNPKGDFVHEKNTKLPFEFVF